MNKLKKEMEIMIEEFKNKLSEDFLTSWSYEVKHYLGYY
jgi:hypothetical protein